MALVGGFFGVMVGIGVAQLVTLLIGFPSTVALWSVLVGLFVATWSGVFLRRLSGAQGSQPGPDCGAAGGALEEQLSVVSSRIVSENQKRRLAAQMTTA